MPVARITQNLQFARFREGLISLVIGLCTAAGPLRGQSHSSAGTRIAGAPETSVAFVNVTVVPMDTERELPGQTVIVQGGRITEIGPVRDVSIPANATRIDGEGKYLLPGLADMHVHIRGSASETDARRALLVLLSQGVTTVRNMDYLPDSEKIADRKRDNGFFHLPVKTLLALRARAASGTVWSPRIYTAGPWAPGTYFGRDSGITNRIHPEPPLDSIRAYVIAYKKAGYDFLKVRMEDPIVFDSVMAAAKRVGIPVVGHVPPGVSIEHALASGMRSIEHLTGYVNAATANENNMADLQSDIMRLLQAGRPDTAGIAALVAATRKAGVWNTPTLIVISDSTIKRVTGVRTYVKAFQDAGAGLLLGTDYVFGDPAGPRVNRVFLELRELMNAGLTAYQALSTGTRNVALFFAVPEESGTIAVGKRADLVLLSDDPLQNVDALRAPLGTMIGGRWLAAADVERELSAIK